MNFRCVFLLLALIFFASLSAEPLERLKVQHIEIVTKPAGTRDAQQAAALRLKTKEGALFSQEEFDEDLKTLAKEYDRVDPQVEVKQGELQIKLLLWLKPKIHSITWEGNKEIAKEKLTSELGIQQGALFDRATFNKAFHKLKNYYLKHGYFESDLDYKSSLNQETNEVDIQIHIKEGRSGTIDTISFHNVTKKEEEELLDLIFTKEYNFFTSWLTNEGTLNPEIMHHDEMTILTYLQNKGYADAKVQANVVPSTKAGRINIDLNISKGELYHVDHISMAGNVIFTTEELEKRMPLKKGEKYSAEQVRESIKAVQDAYGSRGYIDAIVTAESKPAREPLAYDVDFHVQEGIRFRVGLVKVFGNSRTQPSVILHEILLTPGDIFDTTKLHKSEERLRNVGYFKNVNVYAIKSSQARGDKAHFRDIYVEVEENPTTANFSTFMGWSSTESLFGGLSLSESNFNSKGIPQILTKGFKAIRGGGEYLNFNTTIGRKQLGYTLSWTKPYFLDTPWIVGFDASKYRNSFAARDYSIKSYSLQLFASYPINAFVKAGMQYRLRHSFVTLKHVDHSRRSRELVHESKNGGLISAIGPTLSYDSTDHPAMPRRGLRSSLVAEYAGLGGDHQFLKASYLNSAYWAPYEFGLFRLRGNFQFIKTLGSTHPRDLPLDERLFLGGEQSLRGYRYNRVGPKYHDEDHTPRGGVSSVLFSCDYDQYIFKQMDAFLFFDAGNVTFRQLDIRKLRYTAGFGLKVKVLGNAPIVFGMGYPLNPEHKRDVKHFFFSLGTAF